MYLIKNNSTDPAFNLALEEYFVTHKSDEFFCFWRNRPTVVIGRHQDASTEVDFDFLKAHGISLVRRNTGGGAVFHDLGNVNFSYITPCEKRDFFNFEKFSRPVLSALASMDVLAEANGRNDLTIDGQKISGNAQYMHHGRILHHGTLLFESDFSYMQGALRVDPRKLKTKGVSSVRSRVTNIKPHCTDDLSVEEFISRLESHILGFFEDISVYAPSAFELAEIEKLAESKYRNDAWTLKDFGNYNFKGSLALPFGIVNASFEVQDGIITAFSISGDFFGVCDITELCGKLTHINHERESVIEALSGVSISDYISGCSLDDFMSLIF